MELSFYIWIGIVFSSIIITFVLSWFFSSRIGKTKIKEASNNAKKICVDAEKEANTIKREKLLEV
ncbi:DUF3552 domain-containing protein, partial [bacterium]|nr:DUF3552 domain-containing protein [bacterium]